MKIKGHIVQKVIITEKVKIVRELYLSTLLDRLTKGPVIIFSSVGGVDIEETAKSDPEKVIKVEIDPVIGIKDYTVRYLINKSGLDIKFYEQLFELLQKLYIMFTEYDCMLAEINPLAITGDGKLIAVDGKVSVDDNALSRQPDILDFRNSLQEDNLVVEARKSGFLYVPCEPEGNIAVMSNGSGMVMSCMDLISKKEMKVGAAFDLGGGATSERIAEAVRIVLSNKSINTLFISIFGGITRCDEVAGGVKLAMEKQTDDKLVVIRIEGTNRGKGLAILKSIKANIVPVDSITEGVKEIAARRGSR
jgi:succinyl-CoA synthetase beta subunit